MKYIVNGQHMYPYAKGGIKADSSIDFVELEFEFNEDWAGMSKVAQFDQGGKTYFVTLIDDKCKLPQEIVNGTMKMSVFGYIGAKRGTVAQITERVLDSGFTGDGETPIPPTPDLYAQLLEEINKNTELTKQESEKAQGAATSAKASAETAKKEADRAQDIADNLAQSGGTYKIGHGLKLDKEAGNELSVNIVNDFEGDNTLPISAAAVQGSIGNIEAILKTI